MAITDIQISEELETNAPSIKYRGNEGPKSPKEKRTIMAKGMGYSDEEIMEYEQYRSGMEQGKPGYPILEIDEYFKSPFSQDERMGGIKSLDTNQQMAFDDTPGFELKSLDELIEEFEMDNNGESPKSIDDLRRHFYIKYGPEGIAKVEEATKSTDMAEGPVFPSDEDPVNPFQPKPQGPALPDRQLAAYGGIMGVDGRRQYGLGSWLKEKARKLIPNELASIATKAAPFVAPFNPLAAGLMAGIGGFDQTGRIGSSLKSGLMNYGMGQLARGIGGGMGNLQTGFNPMGGMEGMKYGFSNPLQGEGGLSKLLNKTKAPAKAPIGDNLITAESVAIGDNWPGTPKGIQESVVDLGEKTKTPLGILKAIKDFALDNKLLMGLAGGTLGAAALMEDKTPEEIQDIYRGGGIDIESIRAEVREAYKDPTGEKLKALASKYPFLSKRRNIDVSNLAYGGRIGRAEGGLMDLGGMEKDYRAEGGFVPIGAKEKADDVPARLSVNEFVFTADAVRNAGGGDVDKGAEVMENVMKHLEAGGQMSEESQGMQSDQMQGAQEMFETSERLSEVI